MRTRVWTYVMMSAVLGGHCSFAQDSGIAKKIYSDNQDSVYLIYVNGSDGKPSALGSGFQIAAREIVTNAHVIEGGTPVIAVGPVRIPATIERVDSILDLALLRVDVDLTSKILSLSTEKVNPGEVVFAIGNPEGLEKTISAGLVSGIRTIDNQSLLQITAPISHGSSGGPILNQSGNVIGVAVALLNEGQNLNFAIPATVLKTFLEEKNTVVTRGDAGTLLERVKQLSSERDKDAYSSVEGSPYKIKSDEILKDLKLAVESTNEPAKLLEISCSALNEDIDLSILSGRKALTIKISPETRANLAYAIYWKSWLLDVTKKDGLSRASVGSDELAHEAEQLGKLAFSTAKGSPALASYSVASALEDEKETTQANEWFIKSLQGSPSACMSGLTAQTYRGIFRTSILLNKSLQAGAAFQKLVGLGEANSWDWSQEGARLEMDKEDANAATAYEMSASLGNHLASCKATVRRFVSPQTDIDKLLTDGRACLTLAGQASAEDQKEFNNFTAQANVFLAWALNARGVYAEALSYAKESIALDPQSAYPYSVEAKILSNMQRFQESISAAKDAIRLSDGKYADMHFDLGHAYFDVENWSAAEASFRKAAEMDPTNFEAAYNLALSLQRQGYTVDALHWYREALKRNPGSNDKSDVERAIARLSQ